MQRGVVGLVIGIYIEQEILLATWLDVLELIRQGLILREVDGYGVEHVIVLHGVGRATERHNLDARLDDACIGIAIDRICLSRTIAKLLNDGIERSNDIFGLFLGTCRWIGTDGCYGAASNEQHDY